MQFLALEFILNRINSITFQLRESLGQISNRKWHGINYTKRNSKIGLVYIDYKADLEMG